MYWYVYVYAVILCFPYITNKQTDHNYHTYTCIHTQISCAIYHARKIYGKLPSVRMCSGCTLSKQRQCSHCTRRRKQHKQGLLLREGLFGSKILIRTRHFSNLHPGLSIACLPLPPKENQLGYSALFSMKYRGWKRPGGVQWFCMYASTGSACKDAGNTWRHEIDDADVIWDGNMLQQCLS